MKILSLFALISLLLFTTSCSDDDCVPPALEEDIQGTWNGVVKLGGSTLEGPLTVVFNADGTLDDNDLVISGEANGMPFNEKTWELLPDGTTLKVEASNGSGSATVDFELIEHRCDFMSFEIVGFGGLWEFSR